MNITSERCSQVIGNIPLGPPDGFCPGVGAGVFSTGAISVGFRIEDLASKFIRLGDVFVV